MNAQWGEASQHGVVVLQQRIAVWNSGHGQHEAGGPGAYFPSGSVLCGAHLHGIHKQKNYKKSSLRLCTTGGASTISARYAS